MATHFADLLRRHRLAAGLTQEALAERANLSVNGIQKLESGGSHPYRDTANRLVRALDLTREDVLAFQAAAQPTPRRRLHASFTEPGDASAELPTIASSFLGREHEKSDLAQLLRTTRLLTLTGVGGCGKTRLALELARLTRDEYADGVRLVELAGVADPALVPHAVAATLGVREVPTQPLVTTLIAAIKARRMLLLLDNCEHLLDGCAQLVDALLRNCSELRILATSREPLGVDGEVSRRVPSLRVPPLDPRPTPEVIREYAASQLFLERGRAVAQEFVVTTDNARAIAQVCDRLDGIPLALELAAALLPGLSVDDVAARLDQRFVLLTGGSRAALPRQQTLRATIDWSYDLLAAPERGVFDRLSVFAGRWTLEAAEEVCAGDGIARQHVPELLLRLVNKSLVVAEVVPGASHAGGHRYRLLDTLRQYGRERLVANGQSEPVHSRHASYYLGHAEDVASELNGPRQAEVLEELARNESDLRAALEWLSMRGDCQQALRLAAVLGRFWEVRCHLIEGRRVLAAALAVPGAEAPTLARAKVLDAAGMLSLLQGDKPVARAQLRESLALYRQLDDPSGLAWALIQFGFWCAEAGRLKAARRFMHQALELCRQLGDRRGIARCLNTLGLAALLAAEYDQACALLEECLPLSREAGDRWGTAWALTNLAGALLQLVELGQVDVRVTDTLLDEAEVIWNELGERRHLAFICLFRGTAAMVDLDLERAGALIERSLSLFTEVEEVRGKEHVLSAWSRLFNAEGQFEHAARLLGTAFACSVAAGNVTPSGRAGTERRLDVARRALGAAAVDQAFREGSAMSVDAAIAYGLAFQAARRTGTTLPASFPLRP